MLSACGKRDAYREKALLLAGDLPFLGCLSQHERTGLRQSIYVGAPDVSGIFGIGFADVLPHAEKESIQKCP